MGSDQMHPRLLRKVGNCVADLLNKCVNLSATPNRLPKVCENTTLSPVFKTGTIHKPENHQL